jgi:hypothetical protein
MATTYTRSKLSGSTDGKQVKVAASASAGTTIHTAVSGTTDWDEIWIYAVNSSTSTCKLTIQWGGTSDPDDAIEVTIPAESGYILVIPGLMLQNSLIVKAFAAVANVILLNGFINRIATT